MRTLITAFAVLFFFSTAAQAHALGAASTPSTVAQPVAARRGTPRDLPEPDVAHESQDDAILYAAIGGALGGLTPILPCVCSAAAAGTGAAIGGGEVGTVVGGAAGGFVGALVGTLATNGVIFLIGVPDGPAGLAIAAGQVGVIVALGGLGGWAGATMGAALSE